MHVIFFGGREATTGNASAVRRLTVFGISGNCAFPEISVPFVVVSKFSKVIAISETL